MNIIKRTVAVLMMTAPLIAANVANAYSTSKTSTSAASSRSSSSSKPSFGGFSSKRETTTSSKPSTMGYGSSSREKTSAPVARPSFGGFTSRRSAAPERAETPSVATVPPVVQPKPSFGRFNSGSANTQSTAPQVSSSALSNNLAQSSAKARALQAYDSSVAKKAAIAVGAGAIGGATIASTSSTPSTESGTSVPGVVRHDAPVSHTPPNYNPPVAQQSAPPVVIHQNSNDNSMLWYMLGQSSARQQAPVVVHERNVERSTEAASPTTNQATPSVTTVSTSTPIAGGAVNNEDSGPGFFGFTVTILVLSMLGAGIWYYVKQQKLKKAATAPKRNYSL